MRRSARTAVFATAAVTTIATLGRAEHASVTLTYTSAKSATSCPDETTFRGLVAARLGYDPFVSASVRTLAVDFDHRGTDVVGRLELSAGDDARAMKRTLRTSADDCFELATSMALVVAVAVDPNAQPGSSGPPPSTPEAPSSTPPASPASEEPKSNVPVAAAPAPAPAPRDDQPERSTSQWRLELGALLATGVVPARAPGVRAGIGLDAGTWSARAEGAFVSAGSQEHPRGRGEVSAFALAASLVPCFAPLGTMSWELELCAVVSLGSLRSTAKAVTREAPSSTLLASVAPRAAALVMISDLLGLGISAEAPLSLSRTHLYIDDGGVRNEVWAQPRVGFVLAASLVASIP